MINESAVHLKKKKKNTIIKDKMKLTFRKLFTVFKVIIVDKLYKTFLLLETKMLTEIKYIQPPLPPQTYFNSNSNETFFI